MGAPVSQDKMASLVADIVGQQSKRPCKARLRVDMLVNTALSVVAKGHRHCVDQSNGVRQGAADSLVIFAAMAGQVLE